eukprot:Phypoly_transcript_20189.p1 GENE.Phypoly_transcript_20189~~Phypoly_transcript_20189.p1  ORF type:complete len:214 (-),score=31.65 Phypoly_transcript_20189:51-644(-)
MNRLLFSLVALCIAVNAQLYLITTEYQDDSCTTPDGLYEIFLMATCISDPLDNSSTIFKQDSATSVTIYEYSDAECTTVENSTTLSLGDCMAEGENLEVAIKFSVSSSLKVNIPGPALMLIQYSSCPLDPYQWLIFGPNYCFEGNTTNSISFPTCNATTYTVRGWDSFTSCSGSYVEAVNPLDSCNNFGQAYSCYGV